MTTDVDRIMALADEYRFALKAEDQYEALRAAVERLVAAPAPAPVAEVVLNERGGNAGIATRIVEIYDPTREPLLPGTKLYAHPAAPAPAPDVEEIMRQLGKPMWIACDTDGADFDVTFVTSEEEARDIVGNYSASGEETSCTHLYTEEQVRAAILQDSAMRRMKE